MRKVLSFVLVLTLVLGSFSMAFAATPAAISDVAGKDCAEAVRVLTSLGVVTGYEDGSYKPDQVVTRAEATVIVIKALGLAGSVGTQKSSFTDLSGYGWAEGYIAFATQLGITNGYPDGTFKPGQTVNYNEFATMLVRSLGYTDVSLTGTWPAKYVNQAAAVGIMDDVASGGANGANRGDVAIMSNNALTAYIGSVDKDNNWNPIIKSGSVSNNNAVYDTMIGRLGGHFFKGVITEDDDATINIKPYVGKFAEFYTSEDGGKGDIIAVASVKSTSIKGEYEDTAANLTASGIVFEGDDDVDYKMGSNVDSYDFTIGNVDYDDNSTQYFYNGETAKAGQITTSSATELEVALSGKTIRTLYSITAWDATNALKVEAGDLDDIADGTLIGEEFDLDKSDKIIADSYELIGVNSLDEIKADNVVYVYTNDEGDDLIRRVAVGTKVVEGDISKIASGTKWTIDGTTYEFAKNAEAAVEDAEAGDTVKIWLDAYGDIYDADVVTGSAKDYAVILDSGDFGRVKLYLATDSSKVFDTDLSSDEVAALGDANLLIGYGLDKDGAIDSVYPKTTTEAAASYVVDNSGNAYLSNSKVLNAKGGTYAISNDVVVFTLNGSDYDIAKVADLEKGSIDGKTDVTALLRDNKVVAMIVEEEIASGSSSDSYAVVSDKESAKNPAGDKAHELTGFIDGKKMSSVYTSGTSTADDVVFTTPIKIYKLKYNDDNNISKMERTSHDATGMLVEGKISNGYVSTTAGGVATKHAIADNAVVYEVVMDGTSIDKFKAWSGTIQDDYTVYLYETDDDSNGYDIVIIDRH